MISRLIYALPLLFAISFSLPAQDMADKQATLGFKQAEQAITVLRNEGGLLPLSRLDTLRIGYMAFGELRTGPFLETLQQYADITPVPLPAKVDAAWLSALQARFNLLILEVEDIPAGGLLPPSYAMAKTLKAVLGSCTTLTFLNGDGSIFQVVPELAQSAGLIMAPQHLRMSTVVAPQILFGAVGAKGVLLGPIRGTAFQAGDGYTYAGGEALAYTPYAYADMDGQLLEDSIRAIVEAGINGGAYPGAQVLIARHGKVVYHKAFGHHTYDGQQPVLVSDLYDLASVTKISSALPLAMQLHSRGQFDLDAPLKDYAPAFRGTNKAGLTFRSMLSHNARLRPWVPYWKGTLKGHARYPWDDKWDDERVNDGRFRWFTFKADSSRRFPTYVAEGLWLHRRFKNKIYKAIAKSPLNEEPGYVYSGLLFYVLPDIVAQRSGQPYRQYLRSAFYDRIGAVTLGYNPLERFPKARIVPTERDTFFRMVQIHGHVHDEGAAMMGGVSANAGLFSNANDLAKLMYVYANGGRSFREQLIDSASVAAFTSRHYAAEGNRRGLGFDKPLLEYDAEKSYVAAAASPSSFGHSGYTGTFTWADPESGILIVFLSNRVYTTRENRRLYELNIRPRLHQAAYDAIKE